MATQGLSWCQRGTTASTAAAALHQQLHTLHASVTASLNLRTLHSKDLSGSGFALQNPSQRSVKASALPPRQQQQQQRRRLSAPQQRSTLFQQRKQVDQQQTEQQQQLDGIQQQQQQQGQDSSLQVQQQHPPKQQQQQHQQQKKFVWGYLDGDNADEWTWDDDYNKEAIAKAAAEARQMAPTPRQAQTAAAKAVAAQQRPTVITRLPEQCNRQILSNAVLLVDKPARWSSADVVRQLKSALKLDRVCFGAPLEMEATGLLIILLGSASRLTPKLEPLERSYSGTFRLGRSTTTYDASGETLETNPWQHISDADITSAAQAFTGEVQQMPSMWSSSKYKAKPLRWYAERGEVIAREPKSVNIALIQVWRAQPQPSLPAGRSSGGGGDATISSSSSSSSSGSGGDSALSDTVSFKVVASKGASVRVLVHDLGKALGCGAHLVSLRREGLGGFSVDTAWSLDVLLPLARKHAKGFRQAQQY